MTDPSPYYYWAKKALQFPKAVYARLGREVMVIHLERARVYNDLVTKDEQLELAYTDLLDLIEGWCRPEQRLASEFEKQWELHNIAKLDNLVDPEAYTVTDEEFVRSYVEKQKTKKN